MTRIDENNDTPVVPYATVADMFNADKFRARVFDRFHIDYCCSGAVTLEVACERAGADQVEVQRALDQLDRQTEVATQQATTLGQLADSIITEHHDALREEQERLGALFEHVCGHHAADQPEINTARAIFTNLALDLRSHMRAEEENVFGLCHDAERLQETDGAQLEILSARLDREHELFYDQLDQIRELMHGYQPAEGACRKYQALLHGLEQFEIALRAHVAIESDTLMPRLLSEIGSQ